MAWTSPRTWVSGELVTAAIMNTHVRDELNYLYSVQAACHAYNAANQGVTASAALTFDSEDYDVGGLHSTSSNTSRMTIPSGAAGSYLLTTQFRVSALGTSTATVFFRKNGTTALHDGLLVYQVANVLHNIVLPGVALVVGDYVEIYVTKGDASNWDFGTATNGARTQFGCLRVGG